jgi:hypothetical protein
MRIRRSMAAWLALFAMAMQAPWPLVAHSSQLLVPVCTVGGDIHYVSLDGKPAEKPVAATGEHCKLCVFGAAKLALPPTLAIAVLEFEPAVESPPVAPVAEITLYLVLPPAPPRAPPFLSL